MAPNLKICRGRDITEEALIHDEKWIVRPET